jgi:O-acetylserine/cysteine efflux transporter
MSATRLSLKHALLAVMVVAIWGTNFPVMKIAMEQVPPFLIAALRFFFVLFPAVFFLKRPNVPWLQLVLYALFIGAGQFGLIYHAVDGWISPGLASLVIQTQVFFTIFLAVILKGETVRAHQLVGLALAVAGIVLIGLNIGGDTTAFGIGLTLAAGLSWACGNIVGKSAGPVNMLAYVVWSAIFSVIPLAALSLTFEGWPLISQSLADADVWAWLAVLWQSCGNTLFGYAIWGWLLTRYPAAVVAPISLLVPVFGMASSALWLGEPLQIWKIAAAVLVIGGLTLNMVWPSPKFIAPRAPSG